MATFKASQGRGRLPADLASADHFLGLYSTHEHTSWVTSDSGTQRPQRRPRGPHRPHDTFCSFWTFCFEVDVADVTWKNMVTKRGGKIDSITHGRVGRQLQASFTMILLNMSRFPDVCFEIQIRKKKTSAKFKPGQAFCSKLVSYEFYIILILSNPSKFITFSVFFNPGSADFFQHNFVSK